MRVYDVISDLDYFLRELGRWKSGIFQGLEFPFLKKVKRKALRNLLER